ncbi:MAG: hypothetical protein CSB44_11995 [Gammaproteobacteria bacterium]|nr:MAG: hypothetical protein CSB44_11995 [Gammaproteobacteria bacterium]
MPLIALRHTTPEVPPGTCYGRTDLGLAAGFEDEAAAVLDRLPPLAAIVSSPLFRCRELARVIGKARALPVMIDERLIEMDFGCWEGRLWNDIPREELDAWNDDFQHARPHGGESVAALTARTQHALDAWRPRAIAGSVLLVTHAGVIKAALAKGEGTEHYGAGVDFGSHVFLE